MSDNRVQSTAQATQRATLPGLELPRDVTTAQARFNRAVKEHLEVRQGTRGNPYERGLTLRDVDARLQSLGLTVSVSAAVPRTASGGGVATVGPGGTQTFIPFEALAEKLRSTKLFTDLTRRIDDPARFDDLPERTRALLLEDIAQVRQQADASIRRVDDVIKTATESFAQTVTTVQANISSAAAGVRQVHFASASLNRATAGLVTTITARLDNFTGGAPGTATVESKMTAIADRATGLEAQIVFKVQTNGAAAGLGVAATTSAAGNSTSAILLQADKIAFISPSDTIPDPLVPPVNRVPFGVDLVNDVVYINGQVRINTGGRALSSGNGVSLYTTGSSWADATADARILAATGSATKAIGDVVTIANGSTFTQTKYWSGSAWVDPGVVIDGNLLVSGTVSAAALNVSTLSAITANLGSVTAGTITGTADINITGSAQFKGAYTGGLGQAAVYANESGGALNGVIGITQTNAIGVAGWSTGTGVSSGIGVSGTADGATGVGVSAYANAGTGAFAESAGASGIGMHAKNAAGGYALYSQGKALFTSTVEWNGYTYAAPTGSTSTFMRNDGTWADPVTTSAVNAAFGASESDVLQIVVTDSGTATVGGSGINLTCTIAGVRFRATGSNNIVLETFP